MILNATVKFRLHMLPQTAGSVAEDDVADTASVASGRTALGRRPGRRVTFSPDKAESPQEDNFLQVWSLSLVWASCSCLKGPGRWASLD